MTRRSEDARARARAAALALALGPLLGAACDGSGEHADPHAAARDEHGEEGHHDEDEHRAGAPVVLTPAQVEAAGIRAEPAAGGEVVRHLTLPAVVAANADAVTHVNPRAPGVVRQIEKRLGEAVAEGELLCVIDSIELAEAIAELVRTRALVEAGETTLERERDLFARRIATADRVLSGAIEVDRRIHDREKELQEQAVSTLRPLLEADKALQGAELERERELTELEAEREARLLALEVELIERRIVRDAARSRLAALGLDEERIDALGPGAAQAGGTYEIRAPRAGIVAGRHITTGEFVDAQTKLYTLEDLSRVWVLASVFEERVRSVRTGQEGRIRLDAFPGRVFEAEVTLVGYEVDPASRALAVRLELDNGPLDEWPEELPLRPGMFGSVDLVIERIQARVALPEAAIVHGDSGDFVYVRTAPNAFERRSVRVGPPSGEVVEVRAGLEPGEEVVVAGTFQLDSAHRRGELGAGHSH